MWVCQMNVMSVYTAACVSPGVVQALGPIGLKIQGSWGVWSAVNVMMLQL